MICKKKKMKNQKFKIDLNMSIIRNLRNAINEEQHISICKKFKRKNVEYCSWDLVCATMDRIEDTVEYLNSLELNTGRCQRNAFDFIEFVNNAMIINDCISDLAKAYEVPFEQENKSTEIFNKTGKNGKGTDLDFFKYIRSLSSGHPSDTSHYKEIYQDADFECSPFLTWNNGLFGKEYDIHIRVYTNEKDKLGKNIEIKIDEIFEFIKYRYNLINKIIENIKCYQKNVIESYKNTLLQNEENFENYIEYLQYLKKEEEERLGKNNIHLLEYAINVFNLKLSNNNNELVFEKYKNALKHAIKFTHNEIQNMTRDGFANCGIKNNITNGNLLDLIICENCNSEEANKYYYNIEKIGYLDYDSGYENKRWAYIQLEDMKILLEKYVKFENASSDIENYILVNIALYFDSLEVKCELNENIPNDINYRLKLKE